VAEEQGAVAVREQDLHVVDDLGVGGDRDRDVVEAGPAPGRLGVWGHPLPDLWGEAGEAALLLGRPLAPGCSLRNTALGVVAGEDDIVRVVSTPEAVVALLRAAHLGEGAEVVLLGVAAGAEADPELVAVADTDVCGDVAGHRVE
jgi:hypothetical protein